VTDTGLVHDSAELRRLIAENPELPIIVLAGQSASGEDYGWQYCTEVYCDVTTILDCYTPFRNDQVYDDKGDFEEDMANYLSDQLSEIDLSDDEFYQTVKAEVAKYEPYWKKVIAIWADN